MLLRLTQQSQASRDYLSVTQDGDNTMFKTGGDDSLDYQASMSSSIDSLENMPQAM